MAKESSANTSSLYSVHPGVQMVQDWIASLKDRTGRSLDEWFAYIKKDGPKDEAGRRAWLKDTVGLGTNTAAWLAERSVGKGAEEDTPEGYLATVAKYVEDLYAGPKAALRPIHDALLQLGLSLGKDVNICPCKTMVPLYRRHVIAQVKPSTKTRIDFGLALGDTKATGRLIDTRGFAKKDRITHRIAISSLDEIDAEVKRWLKTAYGRDAKQPAPRAVLAGQARRLNGESRRFNSRCQMVGSRCR